MRLYRLCRQKYVELTGYGAKQTGGRWNRKGLATLYTAEHASLAVVEVLVHLDRTELPEDYVLLEIDVADEHVLPLTSSEADRDLLQSAYEKGHGCLPERSVGFSIPSVVVPQDRIVVLYSDAPLHRSVVHVMKISPFMFDRRLFSQAQ